MAESLDTLLGLELPTHPDWFIETSDAESCMWRRNRPTPTPTPLYSIVLMRGDEWSVSLAYHPQGATGEDRTRLEIELFDSLDDAVAAIEAKFDADAT